MFFFLIIFYKYDSGPHFKQISTCESDDFFLQFLRPDWWLCTAWRTSLHRPTFKRPIHLRLAFTFAPAEPTEHAHSRLRGPRIWRCAPGGGTRTPTGSHPGWRRSPCSTAAGQCRGPRRAACSGSRGGPGATAPAGGSVRSDCAAPWSGLKKQRRRAWEPWESLFWIYDGILLGFRGTKQRNLQIQIF